jgi:LPXTG-site transpeptidase (sortase) family protein
MTEEAFPRPRSRKAVWKFIAVFLVVFFVLAVLLYAIDFVPEAPGTKSAVYESGAPVAEASDTREYPAEIPTRIVAPSVGIDTPIVNPVSSDINVLNDALMNGAVRYPESALLGEDARMYIFGHQSHLPVVHNQAFKAFAGLQNLKSGDEVVVYSKDAAYHYRVVTVSHTTADSGEVELGAGDRTLTLSTCDSFGTKSDRIIVTASFVSRNVLTNSNS